MKSNVVKFLTPGVLLTLAVGTGTLAQAQQVHRIVAPDGKVTFSDRPPAASGAGAGTANAASPSNTPSAGLPFELRQVAGPRQ